MKYIIKNCPNFIAEYSFFDACKCEKSNTINGIHQQYCKDIPDCLLKQISDKCNDGFNDSEAQALASEILQLLGIGEC